MPENCPGHSAQAWGEQFTIVDLSLFYGGHSPGGGKDSVALPNARLWVVCASMCSCAVEPDWAARSRSAVDGVPICASTAPFLHVGYRTQLQHAVTWQLIQAHWIEEESARIYSKCLERGRATLTVQLCTKKPRRV